MVQRIAFTGANAAELQTTEPAPLKPGEIRIRSVASLISTGTEGIVYGRLFEPDTHWDRWVKYPFFPGYSLVGEVIELGEGVTEVSLGDRVASRSAHASEAVIAADRVFPVPASVELEAAIWFALAKIAFMGWQAGDVRLGDDVLVIGAGPVGQMLIRWLAAAGVRNLIVLDPVVMRLEAATAGGATETLAVPVSEAKAALGGLQPNRVFDTTGHAAVFSHALTLPANYGTVVLLGDTGSPAEQRLTPDVITRGLRIVGAHDVHENDRWNSQSIIRLWMDLIARGRIDLRGLCTHRMRPDQAAEAYELLATRRSETMGVWFDWRK